MLESYYQIELYFYDSATCFSTIDRALFLLVNSFGQLGERSYYCRASVPLGHHIRLTPPIPPSVPRSRKGEGVCREVGEAEAAYYGAGATRRVREDRQVSLLHCCARFGEAGGWKPD